ncbi:MAG: type IX secretion system membrane protein PorP/SprF [Bacteroidetes bacterium]|nr:type IX secretion system membrane protein PorP/SprF [Bacteroidota bacterium]
MKLKITFQSLFFLFLSTKYIAQKEYSFASTGQEKLLINPAFAGNSNGLNIQTLNASNNSFPFTASYVGVDYGTKKFSYALSNNYFDYKYGLYKGIQTDLSANYKLNLNDKLTLVPSLQVSYLERRLDMSKLSFDDMAFLGVGYNPFLIPEWPQDYYSTRQTKRNISFSSGLLLDINKTITFGVSVYDLNQPDQGLLGTQKRALTQVYHVSGILFKEKPVTLQPYSILKIQVANQNYYQIGAYTSYKLFSLHTAIRNNFIYNSKDLSSISSRWVYLVAGVTFTYKNIKAGYTLNNLYGAKLNAHELFISANLFNKNKVTQRNLMLN